MERKIFLFACAAVFLTCPRALSAGPPGDEEFDFREFKKQYDHELKAKRAPSTAALMSYFLPGSGFIYLGRWLDAAFFLSAEYALLDYSLKYETATNGEEYNVPYKTLDTLRCIEVFSTYRMARIKYDNAGYSIPYEKKTVPQLILAPFSPKIFLKPSVFVPALFAAALSVSDVENMVPKPKDFSAVKDVSIAGRTYSPNDGLMMYEFLWGATSLDAGLGEELLFRGFIQSELSNRMGPAAGLLSASFLFGMLHMLNPGQSENTAYAGFATTAGIYFGYLFMKDDYQLSQPIAAHFWWNFTVGTIAFLKDPVNNPLGAKITFTF